METFLLTGTYRQHKELHTYIYTINSISLILQHIIHNPQVKTTIASIHKNEMTTIFHQKGDIDLIVKYWQLR
jgi:hypothetical protein